MSTLHAGPVSGVVGPTAGALTGLMPATAHLRRLGLTLLSGALFVVMAAGCGNPSRRVTVITVDVPLESVDRTLHKVGPESRSLYGWNHLVGTGSADGEPIEVEMLGNVDYTSGAGSFDGFVTFTWADHEIGVKMIDGRAEPQTGTKVTKFSALLRVIGGTGEFESVSGRGTFTGERDADIGTTVVSHFVLRIEQ